MGIEVMERYVQIEEQTTSLIQGAHYSLYSGNFAKGSGRLVQGVM